MPQLAAESEQLGWLHEEHLRSLALRPRGGELGTSAGRVLAGTSEARFQGSVRLSQAVCGLCGL